MYQINNLVKEAAVYIENYLFFTKRHTRTIIFFVSVVFFVLFSALFMSQQARAYSFGGNNCVNVLTIFPGLVKSDKNKIIIDYQNKITLFSKTIFSKTNCIKMAALQKENSEIKIKTSLFGFLASRNYSVKVPSYPKIAPSFLADRVVVNEPMVFKLSSPDRTFTYQLEVSGNSAKCSSTGNNLNCDVPKLKLDQNTKYSYQLHRFFGTAKSGLVEKRNITTVKPLFLSSSSIASGMTIYDRRSQADLTFNKELASVKSFELIKTLNGTKQKVDSKISIDNAKLSIVLNKEFERKSSYVLVISDAKASDGGILLSPIEISFYVSDGPMVISSNLKNRAMNTAQNLSLSFDQPINTSQDLSTLIGVYANNKKIDSIVSLSGKTVTIDPRENLPFCTKFYVKIESGILSEYNVTSTSPNSLSGQTTCFTTQVVGYSVAGRQILSYIFGSGPTVMYVAGIHGNEQNASKLMYHWIDEIESSPQKVPVGKRIIIIPEINPDGLSSGQRLNKRGVDLNRNFASSDWKAEVKMQWGELLIGGGGSSPLSEPESKALADYVGNTNPYLVISYHSWAAIAEANESGDSVSLARVYSNKSGYRFSTISSNTIFNYDTTGSLEAWLADKKNIANVLVELSSKSYDEFNRNKEGMWSMMQ